MTAAIEDGRVDADPLRRPEPGAGYTGGMRTGWLGFDGRAGPWVAGVAVPHGESGTEYDFDAGAGSTAGADWRRR